MIHPTAIVSSKARIGQNVKIGAFTIIEDDVEIGDNTEIRSSVYIADGARIGKDTAVYSGCVIATEPQDLKYSGEKTYAIIGDRTVLREYVTVNRATSATGQTVLGNDCFIMAYSHIAHDCRVGNNVIMANVTQLAGHVTLEDWVTTGGVTKIVQFCTVGKHVMVGADAKIVKDVPPFVLIGREPPKIEGVNKVGLKRRGFSSESIREIEEFYKTVLSNEHTIKIGLDIIKAKQNLSKNIIDCIEFIENSKKGIYR